ncbi:hypothetical protein RSOLAG22IIIB_04710 [Rhizoctonia solani]|uniref:F-box domain-containing protein n=1 Tax=Rhizoctonia solani TaxID=456999 RepID=A0A0K6FZW2_9AGAM|nr:hypothetical protein RSOLAG22IIIB_04710 [Rhizoctonia solani]
MDKKGYFAYRYTRKYYRQHLRSHAHPDGGHGQRLIDTVPRDPSNFKDWVAGRIVMLENAKTIEVEVVYPDDGVGADDLGFNVIYDLPWMFTSYGIDWTYVIDLDNLVFTINGKVHLRLDNIPPDLGGYSFWKGSNRSILRDHICQKVDLWPAPNFDTKECQQKYEALQPIVIPATEWGAPTWDEMTVSQRFSIEMTHYFLLKTSREFTYAYAPYIRPLIGKFCWNMLCASIPALPMFQEDDSKGQGLSIRALLCGRNNGPYSIGAMRSPGDGEPFKSPDDYCWIRGCLITFCTHLSDPIYVAYEVEQMIQKMRHDGHPESVGIILSSQQELVVVALDGSTVRHSPALDIRTTFRDERPGRASDGRLLLTYLLSPLLTVPPLPWRTRPCQSPPAASDSINKLPLEILQTIIDLVDMGTYLNLHRVSKSIRSVCVANPRVGRYVVLRRIPGFYMIFSMRRTDDGSLRAIRLRYIGPGWDGRWTRQEITLQEMDELRRGE